MSNKEKDRIYELIIFGATGFTGKYTVEEMARYVNTAKVNVKWAVAGRSLEKLERVLDEVAELIDQDLSDIPIITCDLSHIDQIYDMASKTKVLVNCVGPYSLLGEQIVSVCLKTKTHHVDISGEPAYLEKMEFKYHDEAVKKGVYIIGSCGWDSVPADIGFQRAKRNFVKNVGTPYYVESYIKMKNKKGMVTHNGTWNSLIDSFARSDELTVMRNVKESLPKNANRALKHSLYYNNLLKSYCLTFLGSDRSVVYRTQRYNYETKKIQPIDYEPYLCVGQWYHVLMMIPMILIFMTLVSCQCGRNFMKNYPSLCSFGMFSQQGPTREMILRSKSTHFFVTTGTSEKNANLNETVDKEKMKTAVTAVDGPNPGYVATPIYMIHSALTILRELKNLPSTGGVYTPAVAFAATKFEKSLTSCGVQFSTVDMKETEHLLMSSDED